MPEIKGDLLPLSKWCIPGGIGGPSDPSWQSSAKRKRAGYATGWTKEKLASWGVPWPPSRGWRKKLLRDDPMHPCGRPVEVREEAWLGLLSEEDGRMSELQRLMYRDG